MATIPPTPPPLRFDAVRFQPDGAAPLTGLLLTALFACAAAVVTGAIVSFCHQWFYLVVLFPLGMGLAVGIAAAGGVRLGKVRNMWAAAALGFTGGVLVMLMSHLGDYLLTLRHLNQMNPGAHLTFTEFVDLRARQGVTIGKAGAGAGQGMNLGYYGSYIYWFVEFLFACVVAAAIPGGAAMVPFCQACQSWKAKRVLGKMAVGKEAVVEIVDGGELLRLLGPGRPAGHPVVFTAHVCPHCEDQDTVEINIQEVVTNKKGVPRYTDLGTWSYGGEAWPVWQSLFAPPTPPPLPNSETHFKDAGGPRQ